MPTKREVKEDNEILRGIVDSDKRLVAQYQTAKALKKAQKVIALLMGLAFGAAIVFGLHAC